MNPNSSVFSIGSFDFRWRHLLIIGILALSFSISFMLRSQPLNYGFELNEFDPFFNYRATEFLVENGFFAYLDWDDELSWYPYGRNVSATSQVILHYTAAATYSVFNFGASVYEFTIMFPVVFGSLTAIVLFALVRAIAGTTAGLFAAILYSISLPILIRGMAGWFKSEPLGLFYGLLALYLLLSGIKSQDRRIAVAKLAAAGVFVGFGISAWGGMQFLVIPIGIFLMSLPFFRSDHKYLLWTVSLFVGVSIISTISFERPGIGFLTSLGGAGLLASLAMIYCLVAIKRFMPGRSTRNMILFLVVLVSIIIALFATAAEYLPSSSFRYLNAINPFLTTTDPLTDSVSEHATTTLAQSFFFNSILMIFAGLGIWLLFTKAKKYGITTPMLAFALIFGLGGIYVSSTFIRLELFASISVIMLSSIGLSIMTREFMTKSFNEKQLRSLGIRVPYIAGIVFLLTIPLVFPAEGNFIALTNTPPTILNGGTGFGIVSSEWFHALEWIKENTPKDAVVASWWDYGYWVQTMSDRATLADNLTGNKTVITNIARMLLSTPDQAWNTLNEMDADYVLIFVAANKLGVNATEPFYTLRGGGDESKKQWFMRIGQLDEDRYLHEDGLSGTDEFWSDTILGQMFPYQVVGYVNPANPQQQSPSYLPGMLGIYTKQLKLPENGTGPLQLAYSSPSFSNENPGPKLGIFIYKINQNYTG